VSEPPAIASIQEGEKKNGPLPSPIPLEKKEREEGKGREEGTVACLLSLSKRQEEEKDRQPIPLFQKKKEEKRNKCPPCSPRGRGGVRPARPFSKREALGYYFPFPSLRGERDGTRRRPLAGTKHRFAVPSFSKGEGRRAEIGRAAAVRLARGRREAIASSRKKREEGARPRSISPEKREKRKR